jgi:hypothetical protein
VNPARARRRAPLLSRAPSVGNGSKRGAAASIGDPVAQLRELAELWVRGLLSREEFERQKARLLGRSWPVSAPDGEERA